MKITKKGPIFIAPFTFFIIVEKYPERIEDFNKFLPPFEQETSPQAHCDNGAVLKTRLHT